MTLQIDLLHYDQLSKKQLYGLLQLRSDVFVLEQKSFYRDMDSRDEVAWHAFSTEKNIIIGVLRILKDPKDPSCFNIGRVAVAQSARGQGLAVKLMERAHEFISKQEGSERIEISAQEYLEKFYSSMGYILASETPYDDAGIPHIDMLRAV